MPHCPSCNALMTDRDRRKRAVKDSEGQTYIFSLRRLQCPECAQIHLELPDFIKPYKRYDKATIEAVISGNCDCCAADNSTIRRWKK